MKKNYELTVTYAIVTEFNEKNGDWSGDTFGKNINMSCVISTEELKWEDVAKALEIFFPYGTTTEDIVDMLKDGVGYDESNTVGTFCVEENGNGEPVEDGMYLADYDYHIRPMDDKVDLSKLD